MITVIAMILAIVGALNWFSIGVFGFNFVNWIFGAGMLSGIIYVLVGIAGLYLICSLVMNWHRYTETIE